METLIAQLVMYTMFEQIFYKQNQISYHKKLTVTHFVTLQYCKEHIHVCLKLLNPNKHPK